MRWVKKSPGQWDLLAVGSVSGKERREVIGTLDFEPAAGAGAVPAVASEAEVKSDPVPAVAVQESLAAATTSEAAAAPAVATPGVITANDLTTPSNPISPSSASLVSETPTQSMAGLSLSGASVATTETVTETAPQPPQPIITPDVPLSATATDLPAPTPGEKPQPDLVNGGA